MASKSSQPGKANLCPACGKRSVQAEQAGSLTSYLFQPFYCSCGSKTGQGKVSVRADSSQSQAKSDGGDEFCKRCGLQKSKSKNEGSITVFLFQDTRCKCQDKPDNMAGEMVERFRELSAKSRSPAGAGNDLNGLISGKHPGSGLSIDLAPGTVIGGIYKIIEMVGQGGMGEVYLAEHKTLRKPCALKIIQPDRLTESSWSRFQLEAKVHAGLDHINLVKVTDLGIHDGCLPFYAMEYIQGQTLSNLLEIRRRIPLKIALDIFMQVCDGVNYAHRKGLLHRDLKPSNIMLVKMSADTFAVKVVDFGLVKQTHFDRDNQSLTRAGDVLGSPFYMSPEQCQGGKIDIRSDIYSVGCSLFESLTGRPPFVGENALAIVIGHQLSDPPTLEEIAGAKIVPPSMELVMAKLLRKNPTERYQNLIELRSDLEKVSLGEEVQPIYISRTRQANGMEALPDHNHAPGQTRFDQEFTTISNRSGRVALIGGVVLSLVCISLIILAWHALAPKPQARKPNSIDLSSRFSAISAFRDKGPTPASITDREPFFQGVQNGFRVYKFPADISIGDLYHPDWKSTPARGKVLWPVNEIFTFQPTVATKQFPVYLRRFRTGDIQSLRLTDLDFINSGHDPVMLEFRDELTRLPGLKSLDMQFCHAMDDSDLPWLEKFKGLECVFIAKSEIDEHLLAQSPFLRPLKKLILTDFEDLSVIFRGLKGAQQLENLRLYGYRFSLDDAELVAEILALQTLAFEATKPDTAAATNRIIEALKKRNRLKNLTIATMKLDKDSVEALHGFTSLTSLGADEKASTLQKDWGAKINHSLPSLQIKNDRPW
ncbi:MAG: serine/threonine protein kinase [Cyanobacteria bacterium REEB67]|nr:serine/threonine protein kinase [Cyanobacteria bacterium REEB67]